MKKCLIADRHEEMSERIETCYMCGLKIGKSYSERLKEKVALIPLQIKQKFLDIIWEGKTIGEATEACNLDVEITGEILLQNIGVNKFLRKKAI